MADKYTSKDTGNDTNDGSQPTVGGAGVGPYATIGKLIDNTTAGNTGWILEAASAYAENINGNDRTIPSGTSNSNRVTFAAYANQEPIIAGRVNLAGTQPGNLIAYVTFRGLIFDGTTVGQDNGIGDDSISGTPTVKHISFDGCTVRDFGQNGMGTSGNYQVTNCSFHDNGDNTGPDDTAEHNFYISGHTVDGENCRIDGCEIYHGGSLGITLYVAPTDWIIVNNRIYDNGIGVEMPSLAPGNIQMGGSGHFIANNLCYYTDAYAYGSLHIGNGIQVGASATNCEIYHNSCYNNATGIYNFPTSTGTIIKNNACFGNATDYVNDGSVASEDYNCFEDGSGAGGNDIAVNPGWASPGTGDFSITSSPPDPVYAACPRLASVMTDLDGNPRPNPASMGALEPPAGPPPVAGNGTYSQVTLGSLPDDPSHFIGPTCRNNTLLDSNRSYYTAQLSRSGSTYILSLAKILNGVYVHNTDTSAETFTSGDSLRLEVTGSTTVMLSVKKNGVEVLAGTDTSLTADAGYGLAGGGALDAPALGWEAGNINSGVAAQVVQDTFTTGSTAALAPVNGWTQQAPSDGLIYYTGTGAVAGGPYASVDAVVYWTGITASVDVILGVGGGG